MRIRKFMAPIAAVGAAVLALSGCAGGAGSDGATDAAGGGGESYRIGISQLVQHPALDAAATGFKNAFEDEGINVEWVEQNANGEQPTAVTIAQGFASDSSIDLVLAIATPAAQAAATAIPDRPVLFTAVTDPVAADLVDSAEAPGGNVTGTNDLNPVADQIALIKEIVPNAKTVGVVYSSGEVNSEVQVKLAKEAADKNGLTIKEQSVTQVGEVPTALEALGQVDAIYVPTDNLIVSGIDSVMQYSTSKQIPVFSGDTGPVEENGAVATLGLDYEKLGYQTGQMAIRILRDGEKPESMPVEQLTEFELVVNKKGAADVGIELPQAVLDRAATVVE